MKSLEEALEPLTEEEIIEYGDKLLNKGLIAYALAIYEYIGYKRGMMKCGDKLVKQGEIGMAMAVYKRVAQNTWEKYYYK